MKLVNCDNCPCKNSDIENGSECNLGYDIEYTNKFSINPNKWFTVSRNCRLVEIVIDTINGPESHKPIIVTITEE